MNEKSKSIEEKRLHEKEKYKSLIKTQYGSTNHGKLTYEYVEKIKPNFVIDFGCGRNNFINDLKLKQINGIGIDFVFPEADICAPMHETGIESNIADLITSFDSFEHLIEEDVELVLKEMNRVAKNKCKFIFSICTRPSKITVKGENLHPTVYPHSWWINKIQKYANVDTKKYKLMYITGEFKKN